MNSDEQQRQNPEPQPDTPSQPRIVQPAARVEPEGAGMIEAMAWLEVNKKRLAIGALLILLVGFGAYVFSYMSEQKEKTASAALIDLRPPISTNDPPIPATA